MGGLTNELLNIERIQALREICDGEDDLIAELAELYVEELPNRVRSLATAAAARNFDRTRDVAHLIKGASANIGADAMAQLCSSLERAAVAQATDEADDLIGRIEALLPQVCSALAQELGGI